MNYMILSKVNSNIYYFYIIYYYCMDIIRWGKYLLSKILYDIMTLFKCGRY